MAAENRFSLCFHFQSKPWANIEVVIVLAPVFRQRERDVVYIASVEF